MPVELRKRKAPAPAPEPAPKKQSTVKKAVKKVKEAVKDSTTKSTESNGPAKAAKPAGKPAVGDTITLNGFGGEVQTNDGKKTTLKDLVDESKAGVVLFTYPKASTPGCTNQACLFRDFYDSLTKDGLAIYGLSADSTKANTTFKEKQKLPYPLLCDPSATLIGAIGLKKAPKGTQRGVFAVDKNGKVLLAEPGGPAATVEAVKKLVASGVATEADEETAKDKATENEKPNGEDADAAEKKDDGDDKKSAE